MQFLTLPLALSLAFATILPFATARAEAVMHTAQVGQPAPDFSGTDSNGKRQSLSDYKGKIVVLEWTNPECPYVQKHYGSNNMQALQKEAIGEGVVWLSVNSSAKDKQGNQTGEQANAYMKEVGSQPTARILDESGTIGRLYDAKTTPHMFVINPEGVLVYAGAIDDNDSFKPETIKGAKNYVRDAIKSVKAGKPVDVATSKPYGCGVKYEN